MVLTFILHVGTDYQDTDIYQFIFSKDTDITIGRHWDKHNGDDYGITPPPVSEITRVGTLLVPRDSDFSLELLQESEEHPYLDGVEGIVSIGWQEYVNSVDETRLWFRFGESIESVKDKLYSKDFEMVFTDVNNNMYNYLVDE